MESKGNPLALGAMIKGLHVAFYPKDIDHATQLLTALLQRTTLVDIGLMQINYHYHVRGTEIDPASLLDPVKNREMGCAILGRALSTSGELWEGIGRYHSKTPKRTRRYAIHVLQAAQKETQP